MFGKVIEIIKNHIKMINTTNVSQPGVMGYHIIFDERIVDRTPPFPFKTVFYGNVFDYLEQINVARKM